MELDLTFAQALRLLTPADGGVSVILVGCGGTGSWLAPAIVRIVNMIQQHGQKSSVLFVDPDTVEEKNVYRQNFCFAEVGKNKAEVLAERYSAAWGVEIGYVEGKFSWSIARDRSYYSGVTVLVGCLDNNSARREIGEGFRYHDSRGTWWLDCGNTHSYGQILIGGGHPAKSLPGYAGWLPLPSEQHPELVDLTPNPSPEKRGDRELSCAEMQVQDSQGMSINQRMAAEAADYLVRLLVTRDLRKYATYIDLESGTTRSKYITKETKLWRLNPG